MARELTDQEKLRIRSIISDTNSVDDDDLTVEARLNEDLGIDSLDRIEIIMNIEKEFSIHIPDEKVEWVNTVADLYKITGEQLK